MATRTRARKNVEVVPAIEEEVVIDSSVTEEVIDTSVQQEVVIDESVEVVPAIEEEVVPASVQEESVGAENEISCSESTDEVPVRVLELEAELTKLEERIKEVRSELRTLTKKTDGKITKMEQCRQYVADNPNKARKDYVNDFQVDFGLTLAGARTYAQLILSKKK